MSRIRGKIGPWEISFESAPKGPTGTVQATITGPKGSKQVEVRWRRDANGLWLELPSGVYGFDLEGELNDEGQMAFRISQRGSDQHWGASSFLKGGEVAAAASAGAAKKSVRVRAQMPGKIIRVMTKEGAAVEKDQPLLVMEAMKMENEIRAPQAGKISKIKVSEGQAVETGADLCLIEP